ncbi:hypothetical protein SAMN05216516_108112 [Izhakiella capsodis]|uniref:Uncharacterized protein n=1 Tax=Izhakiella capsodis TaxID=1367852 RepID=A0A1I4ZD39_9GAMM|nr:hypothetical protein [Izhakiella capsodis]SFN48108.1 hypothetical protein SAMN05216516_108112 [Izhakiella capsodis]
MKEILNAAASLLDILPATDYQAIADEALEESPTFGFDLDNSEVSGMDQSVWSDK